MDVHVDRLGNVQAAAAVTDRDGGEQQAGLAAIVDGEGHPGQPEDRHAFYLQHHIVGFAPAFFPVQVNPFSFQRPATGARRTGSVGATGNGGGGFVEEDIVGATAGGGIEQGIAHAQQAAFLAAGLAAHAGGNKGGLVAFQAHAVFQLELAGGLIQLRTVSGNAAAGLFDQHVAVQLDQAVLRHGGVVGGDHGVAACHGNAHGRVIVDAATPFRDAALLHGRERGHFFAVNPVQVVVRGAGACQKQQAGDKNSLYGQWHRLLRTGKKAVLYSGGNSAL